MKRWTLEDQLTPRALELYRLLEAKELPQWQRGKISSELVQICRQDFPTFCGVMLKVKPKGGGYVVPFVFKNAQWIVWRVMLQMIRQELGVFLVVLKFRQAGISTFVCAWIFWQCWRQRDVLSLVIAHQKKTAEVMIETMRVFYDEMAANVKPQLRLGNRLGSLPRSEMYFSDRRTGVLLHLASDYDPRGPQATHVQETEFASYPNPQELNTALLPQLPARGTDGRKRCSFIIESTPKGQNAFYDYYMRGQKPDSEWWSVFLPWFVQEEEYSYPLPAGVALTHYEKVLQNRYSALRKEIDGYTVSADQMYWRRMFIADEFMGDEDRFEQEFPSDDVSCFLLLSENLFKHDMRYLNESVQTARVRSVAAWKDYGHEVERPPHCRLKWDDRKQAVHYSVGDPHAYWIIYEPPKKGQVYVIGADVCEGLGHTANDNSVGSVLSVYEGRQVAEYCANIKPEDFADELNAAGRWYHNAMVNPEINKLGFVVLKRLIHDCGYPNMYRWPKWDEVNRWTHKRGWETNERTKLLMMSALVGTIEDHACDIASPGLLAEMSTFQRVGDEYRPQVGMKDDRVIALAIALMAVQQTPKLAGAFNRDRPRDIPTAYQLGISQVRPGELSPLPKAIAERAIQAKGKPLPWDPIGGGIW